MDNIVNCACYANGKRIENLKLEDISEALAKEDQFVWLGLRDPDEALMKQLQEEFGLHELAIEDAHRAHQRPKIESYGDILFIVMRAIALDENNNQVEIGETHFFLGQNFLVSIRHRSSLTFVDVRSRCETTPHLLQKGPGFVLYAIMDYIVDQYFPVIDFLSEELDKLEDGPRHDRVIERVELDGFRAGREVTQQIFGHPDASWVSAHARAGRADGQLAARALVIALYHQTIHPVGGVVLDVLSQVVEVRIRG